MQLQRRSFVIRLFAFLVFICILSQLLAADERTRPRLEKRDHRIEREQWFLRGRTYQGRSAAQLLQRAQRQRNTLRQQTAKQAVSRLFEEGLSITSVPLWRPVGPSPLLSAQVGGDQDYGPVAGRATAVAVDQKDGSGNTVYVGGSGGLWKSTNAANPDLSQVTWTPLIDDQPSIAVGSIAIKPDNSNVLLVGTGEANSSADSYYGLGILRSTDGGMSWTLISAANNGTRPFHGLAFAKIAFSTDDTNLVVAATAASSQGILVGAETNGVTRGIYYSTDAGLTWSLAGMVDPGSVAPSAGSITSVHYNPQQHLFYAASRNHGFYVSANGITWIRMGADVFGFTQPANGLSLANCPSVLGAVNTCPLYRGEIAQVPGRNEMYVWYVNAAEPPDNQGIYQTKDGGKSWASINVSGITNCGDSSGCGTEQGDYNLALTAIPNGATATDIYAGAINIFRCQLNTANPTCVAKPFVNLTHVYGCSPIGSFSEVHPDQHAFDFFHSNPNIMYFVNDGGIYRSLSSLNATNVPASCPVASPSQPLYPFENLNGTMGSMTQFVWFSQHPSDQLTLLGGSGDNGSSAIYASNSGTNGLTWRSVLGGDGGFNDINPDNGDEWFAANARVSLQRCTAGTNCNGDQFSTILNSPRLGGDGAAFYMPYLIDPQDSTKLIIGTCRVWRTFNDGSNPTKLSYKFDGGDESVPCVDGSQSSAPNNMVSALAAGGPVLASGSQVIYVGTEGGHVFVTTNASGPAKAWTNTSANSGFSNANAYPISGIAIDRRDVTGNTAFVTVLGFNTPHVLQTLNGGGAWSNITGNLPDAPTGAAVLNEADGTLYVGTDVGVFSTTAPNGASTVWTEVGPATGTGALPTVAVTRLAIFAPNGQPELLRASTYGRGIWEFSLSGSSPVPDYSLTISNQTLFTFPGQPVSFTGTLTSNNGYSSAVTISCEASSGETIPESCAPAISVVTPSANGAHLSVTAASGIVQDFAFHVKGIGSDVDSLIREMPISLRVIDFSFGPPQPANVTVPRGNATTVQLSITSLGSFDQQVSFSCSPDSLPPGWSCNATPALLIPGKTAQTLLTIQTTTATAVGTYNLDLNATWSTGINARTKSQRISVEVTLPDYSLTISSQPNNASPGGSVSFKFRIASLADYSGTVAFSCTATAFSCTFNPVSHVVLTPGSSVVVTATMPIPNNTADGSYMAHIDAVDQSTPVHQHEATTASFQIGAAPDFVMPAAFSPANATVTAGHETSATLSLNAQAGFNLPVAFTIGGCPSLSTCTISPNPAFPTSSAPATAALTINTTAVSTASLRGAAGQAQLALWLALSSGVMGLFSVGKRRLGLMLLLTALVLLFAMVACGGGAGGGSGTQPPTIRPGTPAGNYTIVVTGTAGTIVKSTNFTLTVQ